DTVNRVYLDTVFNRTYDTVYSHEYDTIRQVIYDTVNRVYLDTVFNRTYDTVYSHEYDTIRQVIYDTVNHVYMDTVFNRTYDTVYSHNYDTIRQMIYDTVTRVFLDTVYQVVHDTVYSVLHDTIVSIMYDTVYSINDVLDSHYVDSVVSAEGRLRDSLLSIMMHKLDSLSNILSQLHTSGNPEAPGDIDTPGDPDSSATSEGVLSGVFSVGPSQTVRFSQGNLQYRASDADWRFADHQYDYLGNNNTMISETNSNYIDLFGWGTSGWASGAASYMPYSHTTNAADYFVGGNNSTHLTGTYANADWGVYNPISNGGGEPGMWRTLSRAEWNYLLNTRENAFQKRGQGTIIIEGNPKYGLFLIPDEFELPASCTFSNSLGYYANEYTQEQWSALESAGVVFLPVAGRRSGVSITYGGMKGFYWSVTPSNDGAYSMNFDDGHLLLSPPENRYMGISVRLVKDE
ncbi:MAG: hypothetical protein MJZ99_10580, partial [Bacteroidales bacterium]|nr:hypothetical protein [Bacteroidales bacterium]